MRRIPLAAAVTVAAATAVLGAAGAASAAPSADTSVTFLVAGQGGDLSITAGPVGAVVPQLTGDKATGPLPTVSVTDNRNGSPRQWAATASSTDFTSIDQTIPKANVTYEATAIVGKVGGGTVTGAGPKALGSAQTVVSRTGLNMPLEVITWTPSLTVSYPGGAALGAYTGTVTVSVA